jgi:hypothetical protein
MTQLKTICSGCKVVIRDGATDKDGNVSHGLCPACTIARFPGSKAAQRAQLAIAAADLDASITSLGAHQREAS